MITKKSQRLFLLGAIIGLDVYPFQFKVVSIFRSPTKRDAADSDFDPLISPHVYINGTDYNKSQQSADCKTGNNDIMVSKEWSPMKINSAEEDFQGASREEYIIQKSVFTAQWSSSTNTGTSHHEVRNIELEKKKNQSFDPRISPHFYSRGSAASPKDFIMEPKLFGILIVDHGSRKAASNERLQALARIYKTRAPSYHCIKYAHMEIAKPSIEEAIRNFCEEGISDVVCHPYFLSPGRHVQEDIPQLVEIAVENLKKEGYNSLNVIITDVVGKDLNLMADIISDLVKDTLGPDGEQEEDYRGFVKRMKQDGKGLGGFFGEVQRMVDEQL